MTETAAELETLRADQPGLVRLARLASVAAVVEPALLRRLRLEVPGAGVGTLAAGVEADLWFSPLSHVATSRQLTLRPDVLEVLRAELQGARHRVEREAARAIVLDAHGSHSDLLQLEERVIWAVVTGDAEDVGLAWERAVATLRLGGDRAADVVRWFLQARRRLPASALQHPVARRLSTAAAMHLDRVVPPDLREADRFPDAVTDLAPPTIPETTVGVRLTAGGVRFVQVSEGPPLVALPDTRPLVMEVSWQDTGGTGRSTVVTADAGGSAVLEGLGTTAVLRTLDGRRYAVRVATGDRVTFAVFGTVAGLTDLPPVTLQRRVTDALDDPRLHVEVIRDPRDLAARPDLVMVGPGAQRRRDDLFSVVRAITRAAVRARAVHRDAGAPLGTVIFLTRAAQRGLLDELRDELGDAMAHVLYESDPAQDPVKILAEWAHRVARGPARLYQLDVETARSMLGSLAVAFHSRTLHPEVRDEEEERRLFGLAPPADPGVVATFEHVVDVCERVFDRPVRDYLDGGGDPTDDTPSVTRIGWSPTSVPWGSFAEYLHWLVDRLHDYAVRLRDGLGSRTIRIGHAVPAGVLEAARLAIGTRLLPDGFDAEESSSVADATTYAVDRADLPALVTTLAEPVLRAVDAEAARRAARPAPMPARVPPVRLPALVVEQVAQGERTWRITVHREGIVLAEHSGARDLERLPQLLEEGGRGLSEALRIGGSIAEQLPADVLRALAEVPHDVPDSSSVLVRLDQWEFPWELALMEKGGDSSLPPFLGCQLAVSNQPFASTGSPRGILSGQRIGVIAPHYAGRTDHPPLSAALAEAAELTEHYRSVRLPTHLRPLLDELERRDDLAVLHLAGHFSATAKSPTPAFLLDDGGALGVVEVGGLRLRSAPLVFLSGPAPVGLAVTFLRAGASAVVAPAWMVHDAESQEVARRFYTMLLHDGIPADEALRRLRCQLGDPLLGVSALGYRLFVSAEWSAPFA